MDLKLVLTALGLALVLEGLPYFLLPGTAGRAAAELARLPRTVLRLVGLASMLLGLLAVWLARLG